MHFKDLPKLILSIIVCQSAGLIGSVFTVPAIDSWYANLQRPALNPPSWVFGPVWTALYLLMGIAAFLIWQKGIKKRAVQIALAIFALQLILNTLWSILFFGLQSPGLALVDLAVLWLAIIATIFYFSKISKTAAWLLLPYLLWVSFAGYLNYAIWRLI